MEGLYGNHSSRVSKLKVLDGNGSPISVHRDNQLLGGGSRYQRITRSASFDSYASVDNSNLQNLDPSLIRYLRSVSPADAADEVSMYRQIIGHDFLGNKSSASSGRSSGFGSRGSSGSPLSSMENLETPPPRSSSVFSTPLKVEEDVLVMDGILVGSVPSGRVRSSTSSDSSGSSSGSKSHFKTEICRPWEDSGSCRYGSKCQFAHGKEELRPTRVSNKNKSEVQICKSFTSSGTCTYGSKCRFGHHQVTAAASPTESGVRAPRKTKTISPIKLEHDSGSNINEKSTFTSTDWSPQDDGVEVVLPSSASTEESPSREEVNAYIHSILYGPIQRKRLPVFAEICPE